MTNITGLRTAIMVLGVSIIIIALVQIISLIDLYYLNRFPF